VWGGVSPPAALTCAAGVTRSALRAELRAASLSPGLAAAARPPHLNLFVIPGEIRGTGGGVSRVKGGSPPAEVFN